MTTSELPLYEFFPETRNRILNNRPKRLPVGTNHKDAGDFYAKCSIAQMEENDFLASAVYTEWAYLEYTKGNFPELAGLYKVKI